MSEAVITKEVLEIINQSIDKAVQEAADRLTVRLSQEQERYFLESLVSISLARLIQIGTEIGTQSGIEAYQKEKQESTRQRFQRRLHNTKLLLKEYRKLKEHATESVFKKATSSDAIELLEELKEFEVNDELYIEAIKTSKEKTGIILCHIEKMFEIYKHLCEKNEDRFREYNTRKWKVIYHYYISINEEKNINELCDMLNCGRTCVYNDIDDAVRSLTTLLFGIDGLNLNNKFQRKK